MARKPSTSDREWRVSVIRAKTVYLGRVWAPDKETAIARAAEEFAVEPARAAFGWSRSKWSEVLYQRQPCALPCGQPDELR